MSAPERSAARDDVVADVAAAVDLAEGDAGVRRVIRAIAQLEPVPVREVSRATELPVPVVAAICNELRKRGIVGRERPVRLTPRARELFPTLTTRVPVDATCPTCEGRSVVVPERLAPVRKELEELAAAAPPADVLIDQSHCTVETKLRRAVTMLAGGAVVGNRILFLGDDDLGSIAVARVAARLGVASSIEEIAVVDVDQRLLSFLSDCLAEVPFRVTFVHHDLRRALPDTLATRFDTVFTDPPFTVDGAELFLSRAVEATAPGGDSTIFFAFGARRPEETLRIQRAIGEMKLVVRQLIRNFNEYVGAGIIGATSHLYHLATTMDSTSISEADYSGPLYSGALREQPRPYRCTNCELTVEVGSGRRWQTVSELQHGGCPRCGAKTFRALPRSQR
jgi:predicted methyltransferase